MKREARPGVFSNSYQEPKAGDALTPRQIEAADLLCEGLTYHEIAARMGCSQKAVERHLQLAYMKAGVTRAVPFGIWWVRQREAVFA